MEENGSITNCINNGSVSGSNYFVGCICGSNSFSGSITNCVNNGTVNGSSYDVGGICGRSNGSVTNCVNNGTVTGGSNAVGGICGNNYDSSISITNCYSIGDNATYEQLNSKEFYTDTLGWNEEIWDLNDLDVENGKYPTLK